MQIKKVTFDNTNSQFFRQLNTRIRTYFKENNISPNANANMVSKTIIIAVLFVGTYLALVFGHFPWYINIPLCILMGLNVAAVGFNIMHDSAHGSYSKNKTINSILSFSLDILGGSVKMWKTKHNVLHHTYTNIPEWDNDIEQDVLLRLAPNQPLHKVHRYQHIYATILYGFLTLLWVYWADYKKLIHNKVGNYPLPKLTFKDYFLLFFFKAFHIFYALVLPSFFNSFWYVLLCYLLIQFTMGVVMALIFQLAHVYDGTQYPEPDPNSNSIHNEWAKHQIATTANFAMNSKIISWFAGGLNFQVEHHLFPNICHVHYPKISKIVQETCAEYGIKYNNFKTIWGAIYAHYRQLYRLGRMTA